MQLAPDIWLWLCLASGVLLLACALAAMKPSLLGDSLLVVFLVVTTGLFASERIAREAARVIILDETPPTSVSTMCGVVRGFPQQARDGTTLVLSMIEASQCGRRLKKGQRVLLRTKADLLDCVPGDTVAAAGTLRNSLGPRNPGGFSEASYLFREGVWYVLEVPGFLSPVVRSAGTPGSLLAAYVAPARRWVRGCIQRNVPGQESAFLMALILGDRGRFPEEMRSAFRDAGIVHVLSVSGLHTALVGLAGVVFLKGMGLRTRKSLVGSICLVWFYCSLTGFHPPTVRASFMLSCMATSRLLGRSTELFAPLCTSCAVLLVVNPRYFWDTGFQLSYVAAGSIIAGARLSALLGKKLGTPEKIQRYVVSTSITTSLAQTAVLPILALQFGSVSAVAVPANLVAVPLASAGLVSAFCSLWVALVVPWAADSCFSFTWLLLRLCNLVAGTASSVPYATLELAKPHSLEVVAFLCCFFFLLDVSCADAVRASRGRIRRGNRRKALLLLLPLVCLALLGSRFLGVIPASLARRDGALTVDFLDVGQGDAAVVRFPEGQLVLIDSGDRREGWDTGERVLAPYLRESGSRSFDAAVVSHFHSDHSGGLLGLVEKGRVRRILCASADTASAYSVLLRTACSRKDVLLESCARGDTLFLGEGVNRRRSLVRPESSLSGASRPPSKALGRDTARLIALHPSGRVASDTSSASLNDSSLVCSLEYGRARFIFAGDVGREVMDRIGEGFERAGALVLKVPHHGARTSLSLTFVENTRPDHAVFSVGKSNRFGHPAGEVVETYSRRGATILRTDRDGSVRFTFEGDSLVVTKADPRASHPFIRKARKWRAERALRLLALLSIGAGL